MKNNNGGTKLVGRRRTLQLLGMGIAAGGLFAAGCSKPDAAPAGGDKPATTGGTPSGGGGACTGAIDDTSKMMRKTLQYNDKATEAAKACSGCAQYDAGKFGACGGCKLFTGPVQPSGSCLSFAPKSALGDGGKAG